MTPTPLNACSVCRKPAPIETRWALSWGPQVTHWTCDLHTDGLRAAMLEAGWGEVLTAERDDRTFALALADALIAAMCKADPEWDPAHAKEVRSHMRATLAAVGVKGRRVAHEARCSLCGRGDNGEMGWTITAEGPLGIVCPTCPPVEQGGA